MLNLKPQFLFILFFVCIAATNIQAQLFIDTSYTAEEMGTDFFSNSCVTPSNISYTGASGTYAFFDAGNTTLGVSAGIFLGSGFAVDAVGPNDSGAASGVSGGGGDSDLEALIGGGFSSDAAILEMDIMATGSQLEFSYVFASEEYPEFVNTGFNDVFAFFISGPGLDGLQNISMVANSSEPVSINTINEFQNAEYYVDNSNGLDIQFDGYTTELSAEVAVTANETYHIKIAIADMGDNVFDSGIFLGIESLCGDSLLVPPAAFEWNADGLDMELTNLSRYATSYLWDFGDNMTSSERNPGTHVYDEDGVYEVSLITQNYCCSDTLKSEVTVGNPSSTASEILNEYQFFPNPVLDIAQIIFEEESLFELKILDASGHLVFQKSGNGRSDLNLQHLSKGLYFMEVYSNGKTTYERFIKM